MRRHFSELSPFTYKISVFKETMIRHIQNAFSYSAFATEKSEVKLPLVVYNHNSLIRRRLGNVDLKLQENKATNLALSTPKITGVLIKPGEVFSLWNLVGSCTTKKGYRNGLIIRGQATASGVGGGMCQLTNLIHWMVLHSPLDIVEHHHHNAYDLFPDYNRQVPFGMGTSIMYNYLDYRFKNNTQDTFQLIVYTTDEYLCGELRCDRKINNSYHIYVEEEYFDCVDQVYYRHNRVRRKILEKMTGEFVSDELLLENHARVMYDAEYIPEEKLR